jgi:hypothetical protein
LEDAVSSKQSAPYFWPFDVENFSHWWFGNCPKSELFNCWDYEYLRDCPSIVVKVLNWRKENGCRKKFLDAWRDQLFVCVIPEWPWVPYLQIDPQRREWYRNFRGTLMANAIRAHRTNREPAEQNAIFLFRWQDSDTGIVRQLKQLLKEQRPRGVTIDESRGRSLDRTFSADLKALGAWRLNYVMSQNKVIAHAIEKGCCLYKNQPELSKAVERVFKKLMELDQTPVDA